MKFSLSWINDYLPNTKLQPKRTAELLTMHSFETEGLEEIRSSKSEALNKSQKQSPKYQTDWVLDLDILPNRMGDAAGHFGVARELAAVSSVQGKPVKALLPKFKAREDKTRPIEEFLAIVVQESEPCPRYAARVIFDVKVGPSPEWLRDRLASIGVGSINNIVDAANYVMLELGQPLHAFDFDKLHADQHRKEHRSAQIIVRRAKKGEEIETLDGEKRMLDPSVLVIADAKNPVAIAGIKGGAGPAIDRKTKTIVLESAHFDQLSIRASSRKLGLRSDASVRFEHGVDWELPPLALDRVTALIQEIAGGVAAYGVIDVSSSRPPKRVIPFRVSRVQSVLGVSVKPQECLLILKAVGCSVVPVKSNEAWRVVPPSFRQDLILEEDLIEEVGRLFGYERISSILPHGALAPALPLEQEVWMDTMRDLLVGAGFTEILSYAFIGEALLATFGFSPKKSQALENPVSNEFAYLRPSLLPVLCDRISRNIKFALQVRFFEMGRTFLPDPILGVREKQMLSIGLATTAQTGGSGEEFAELKGAVTLMLEGLGIGDVTFAAFLGTPAGSPRSLWHPARTAEIRISGRETGLLGEVHPAVMSQLKGMERGRMVVCDIDLGIVFDEVREEHEYREPSRFPEMLRDIAVLVPQRTLVDEVASEINAAGGALVRDVDLFDYYEGEELPAGKKNLAFHIAYQAEDRTLIAKEVDAVHEKIVKALGERGWEIR